MAGIAEFETQKSPTRNKQATQLRISLFFSTAAIQAVTCDGYIPYITYSIVPAQVLYYRVSITLLNILSYHTSLLTLKTLCYLLAL